MKRKLPRKRLNFRSFHLSSKLNSTKVLPMGWFGINKCKKGKKRKTNKYPNLFFNVGPD